jgi:2-polyprenyl-6-methoxyphenol hydroxylase-like FAD-dependent oxidoreductase
MRRCQVAVVGGSIAGCAAAAELARAGCEVSVFERSAVPLDDRGAGISAPPSHLHLLRSRGLVDAHMPTVDRSRAERVFTVHDSTAEGRILAAQRISTHGMRWMQL